jgi:predicted porin
MSNNGEGNNLAAHPFDNDNLDDSFYIDNAVKYTSPTFAGLQFEGLYGFSNQAGGFANNRAYSAGVSYSNGPINLAASYLEVDNAGGGPLGTNTNGAVSSNDNPYFISSRQRVAGVGGNYTFGSATVGLLWTHTMFDNVSAIAGTPLGLPGGAGLHMDNYEVNARYALTPALTLAGAYTFTDGRFTSEQGASDPKWNQVTLMTDYSLSKRTDIYLEGVYQHVSGAQAGSVLSDAMINGVSASSTGNQVLVTSGIRHSF